MQNRTFSLLHGRFWAPGRFCYSHILYPELRQIVPHYVPLSAPETIQECNVDRDLELIAVDMRYDGIGRH